MGLFSFCVCVASVTDENTRFLTDLKAQFEAEKAAVEQVFFLILLNVMSLLVSELVVLCRDVSAFLWSMHAEL
jgi:hypothetical protein